MNKDIKANLDDLIKARKEGNKPSEYTLLDVLQNECGLSLREIETYYVNNK
jgi:hypothetical protein